MKLKTGSVFHKKYICINKMSHHYVTYNGYSPSEYTQKLGEDVMRFDDYILAFKNQINNGKSLIKNNFIEYEKMKHYGLKYQNLYQIAYKNWKIW